ncbi:MAG: hypothetical protein JWQ02_3565 [Capsulimonas sp.]|jgi:prepilin-type processing-associated H-X9-DG protein|nr:hypothetical protein [Capsulimonas sp.]
MIGKNLRKMFPNWINVVCFLVGGVALAGVLHQMSTLRRSTWAHWKQMSCPSNLKTIGLGMMQYAQDNDEMLPPRQNNSEVYGSTVSWRAIIWRRGNNGAAYCCPINPAATDEDNEDGNDLEQDGFSRSYAVNSTNDGRHGFGPFADRFLLGLSVSQIKRPELVVGVVETTAAFNDFNLLFPEGFTHVRDLNDRTGYLFSGHNGVANYLYMDGHVKAMPPMAMLDEKAKFNPWTIDGAPFLPGDAKKARTILEFSEKQSEEGTK